MDNLLLVRASTIEGTGLFAAAFLPAGTVLARLEGHVVTDAELAALFARSTGYVDTISLDTGRNLVLSPGQPIRFGNHSCEPTMWHADERTLVARHDIEPGRELTVDYATQTADPGFRLECRCAAAACRRVITGNDWQIKEFQRVYRDHVVPAVKARMTGVA